MLAKLFKHELIDLFKKTILYFSIVIGLSLLVFLFGELGKNIRIFSVLKDLMFVGYVFSIIGIILYSVIYPVVRYYRSLLSDEGYLTHTLPVTTNQLLFSKLICAFLLFLSSIIVAVLSLLFTNVLDKELLDLIVYSLNPNKYISYAYILFYLVVYYFAIVMMFITSMTIGHSSTTKKVRNSIVVGIVIYIIQQTLGLIGIGITYLINPNIFDDIINQNASAFTFYIIGAIVYLLLVVFEIVVTRLFLKNKLNLE